MTTIDYIDLQDGLMERAYGGATDQPAANYFNRIRRIYHMRLADAWQTARWPDLSRIEQREYRQTYAAATTYSKTNERFFLPNKTYYQSLRDSNTGNAPATLSGGTYTENSAYWAACASSYSPNRGDWLTATAYVVGDQVWDAVSSAWYQCHTAHTSSGTLIPSATGGNERWGVLTQFDRYISSTQTGETEMGDVLAVYRNNPYLGFNPDRLDTVLSNNGVQVINGPAQVYVDFRLPRPYLKGDLYSATSTYTANVSQVYYSSATTRGNFYDCIVTTTAGQSPDTTAASWRIVSLPRFMDRYLIQGAYADWLEGDGQLEKSLAERNVADRLLANLRAVLGQQGQRKRPQVITR